MVAVPEAAADPNAPDVVVVGGGIAGITVAVAAAQRGLSVVLLEQGPRLGGRARSWKDPTTGDPIPIGPHMVLDIYPNLWKLLEILGTRDKIVWQEDEKLFMTWVQGTKETEVRYAPLPAPLSYSRTLLNMIRDFPDIEQADCQANVAITLYAFRLTEEELLALDNESGLSILQRFNVTERFIDHFWAFVSHAIFNVPLAEVSACALLRFYRILVGSSKMQIGFSGVGLGDLFTPAERVLTELGAKVRLRTKVDSLVTMSDNVRKCEGVVLESGEVLRPRVGVVVTLPAYQLSSLLRKEWLLASPQLSGAADMKPCAYVCIYFWFDRKLTTKKFWARAFTEDSLTCDWYDFSNIYLGWEGRPSFIGVNMIDTNCREVGRLSDEEVVEGCMKELCEYLPHARDAKLLHTQVTRVACAIHRPIVGTEKSRVRPGACPGVDGLFIAGDWTATELPYCMDSAASAGWMCSEDLLHAAEARGCTITGSKDLRVPLPDIDLTAKALGYLDAFRPLNIWFSGLRGRGRTRVAPPAVVSKL